MPWWGWMILGLFLLGSELLIVDAAFFLVFVGAAAIVTGGLLVLGLGLEPWMQWLLFSALALTAMVLFRKRVYSRLRRTEGSYQEGPVGDTLRLAQALDPGESARQSFRGSDWTVINRGVHRLAAGTDVLIERTEGLTIIVGGLAPASTGAGGGNV